MFSGEITATTIVSRTTHVQTLGRNTRLERQWRRTGNRELVIELQSGQDAKREMGELIGLPDGVQHPLVPVSIEDLVILQQDDTLGLWEPLKQVLDSQTGTAHNTQRTIGQSIDFHPSVDT